MTGNKSGAAKPAGGITGPEEQNIENGNAGIVGLDVDENA